MTDPRIRPGDDAAPTLAAIVESSDDAIIAKDLDGTILSWNHGAELMYGYAAAEIIGRSIYVIVPPAYVTELSDILKRIRVGDRVRNFETVRVTKQGGLIDVALSISPIRDASGTIVGASAIAREITERRREVQALKDSEARLRSVLESAVDGIVVIDAQGRIESFNPAAERLFGYRAGEVISHNVNLLMPSPYQEAHDRYMANYLATGVAKIIGIGRDVIGRRKDGTTFPLHLSVGEMVVGGERKFTGLLHDLTARVKVEGQLREQASLVRLGEMAAVIAHEVKNPLAAVRGAIQVIGKRLPAGGREASVITDIIARIDALNQLVRDLLLFARPPRPNPTPVDLAELLSVTGRLIREDAACRDVHVVVSGSCPSIMADVELLKIVFLNLFLNSAHAMRHEGAIRVSLTAEDASCRIAVIDSGPGIPPEVRARLFTPFVTTKSRGTGLGLSTVKRLVEAHGGEIRVDCPSEGGTTVVISLPLAAP
ncbi:MAG: PAS domain S-box protein [Acidobacteriota bacterium]